MSYNKTTPRNTSRFRFEQYSIVEKNDFYTTQATAYSDEFNPRLEIDEELRNIERFTK